MCGFVVREQCAAMSFHDVHSSLQDGVHKLLSCPSPCAMQVLCILSFSPTRLCSFFFLVSSFWVWKFSLQSNACMNYGGFGCWNQKSKGKGKHLLLWVGWCRDTMSSFLHQDWDQACKSGTSEERWAKVSNFFPSLLWLVRVVVLCNLFEMYCVR